MTFSVVGHHDGQWGIGVASKFLAAGAVVPYAQAGVGAVATQAYANPTYGPAGLAAMAEGVAAADAVRLVTDADDGRALRQVGMVDARGVAATFTGEECLAWAGGVTGPGFCCQGNILAGPEVIESMATAYGAAEGALADRLLAALAAGDAAGGDRRGRQAAGLFVVRSGGGYLGGSDVSVDLRVDDHTDPVGELARLYGLHRLLFPAPGDLRFVRVDGELESRIRRALAARGYPAGTGTGWDDRLRDALFAFVGTENLEARWREGGLVEQAVLDVLLA